jgi:hypothetical protein
MGLRHGKILWHDPRNRKRKQTLKKQDVMTEFM